MSDLTDAEIHATLTELDKSDIGDMTILAVRADLACQELQRRRLADRCTVDSNECTIRRQCTNKCGRMTLMRDVVRK